VARPFFDGGPVRPAEPFGSQALMGKNGDLWAGTAWACPMDGTGSWSLESVLFIRPCDYCVMLIKRVVELPLW